MNSRLRDNIGLSTSPATGSNVHRSSPLSFGEYIFVRGRSVSAAFLCAQFMKNDRRIINQEAAVENKNASKKKTEEPMSLKDKKGQAIAGSKRIAEERAERRRLMGLDV